MAIKKDTRCPENYGLGAYYNNTGPHHWVRIFCSGQWLRVTEEEQKASLKTVWECVYCLSTKERFE